MVEHVREISSYGYDKKFYIGSNSDFNKTYAIYEKRFWYFLETTQDVEAACEFDKHCELPMNLHMIKEDLVKDKTKVIDNDKFCDNWCDKLSSWIEIVKNKIKRDR